MGYSLVIRRSSDSAFSHADSVLKYCRLSRMQLTILGAWRGLQVRMALPLECSHVLSCPSRSSLLP